MKNHHIVTFIDFKRAIKVMKLTLLLLVVCLSQIAASTYSQTTTLSITVKNEPLENVLKKIEKQTEFLFFYNVDEIDKNERISLSTQNSTIKEILDEITRKTNLSYSIKDRHIVLTPKSANSVVNNMYQQDNRNIAGVVIDEKGEPVIGANILIKGTSKGTMTDIDGKFTINIPERSILVVSYLGYRSKEVPVGNQSSLSIVLAEDAQALDEVIVVGYGTMKRSDFTGSMAVVKSETLENRPVSNLASALQGTAAGLTVQRTTGQPGQEEQTIQIRGAVSANGNVSPLLIVDGVPSPDETLQTLNPNDIENISILKDAATASIYGAQAAGGVILITTKSGQEGKTVVEYNGQFGIDWALNVPDRLQTWEEAEYSNLARINAGTSAEYGANTIEMLKDGTVPYRVDPNDTTRWQFFNTKSLIKDIVRNSTHMQSHNVTARGGTSRLNYLISLGLYDKQGVYKLGPDKNRRYNVRFNVGSQFNKYIYLDSRITYTRQEIESSSANSNQGYGLLFNVYRQRQINPPLTPDGKYNFFADATSYALLESGGFSNIDRNYFDGVFTLKFANFVKGLQFRAVYGAQYRRTDKDVFKRTVERWYRTNQGTPLNNPNSYSIQDDLTQNSNLQFLVDYNFSIKDKNNFSLLAGYQWEDNRWQRIETATSMLVSNDIPALNLGDDKTKTNNQSVSTNAFQSVFGRLNYNFDNRYLLDASIRMDASSRLSPGSRTQVFPSFSAGWNMHRESWLHNSLPFMSVLKLRASWGTLGNAKGIGNYDYLALLSRGTDMVLGYPEARASYIYQKVMPSSDLSWEIVKVTNAGFDMGLFNNRLSTSFDYFIRINDNMLTPLLLPATYGIGTAKINNGKLKSWGWEIEVSYRDKIGKDFTYSISANVSDNKNKLVEYAGQKVIKAGTVGILEGYPLNTMWGYKSDGYFQTQEDVDNHVFQDNRTGAGDVKYQNLNGDDRISIGKGTPEDHGDLVCLGTTDPRYLFGFTLGMEWKGFDFTAFFQGVGKRNFMPAVQSLDPKAQNWLQPLSLHQDYWTPERRDALFPRPYLQGTHNYQVSDKWVLNARYVRLKNLQIGYNFSSELIKKIKMQRMRVYISAQDILTFSSFGPYKGYYDPEQRNGVDADYPFFATVSLGLNISF